MIRQRFQFLGKCHNKNLPILHKGIFRGLGALFVFFGKTGDDIRNAQLYGCHINGGNKGIRHALAACVRHALELPQNDDIAACLDFCTGVDIPNHDDAAFKFNLLPVAQRALVELCQIKGSKLLLQKVAQTFDFVVFCFHEGNFHRGMLCDNL
mgnify:FL=1